MSPRDPAAFTRPLLEELWRGVWENPRIGIAVADVDGRLVASNPRYQSLVGYSEEELRDLTFLDLTDSDQREENRRLHGEIAAGLRRDFQFEKRYVRKDGKRIWVRLSVSIVPGPEKLTVALVEEITERKQALDDLKMRERQLSEAQAISQLGSWEWDPRGDGTAVWSDELRRMFGVGAEFRPSTESFLGIVHPDDRDATAEALRRSLEEIDVCSYAYRIVRGDGKTRSIRCASFAERDARGAMVRVVGVVRDVTEDAQAKDRLDRSLSELRALSARLEEVREEEAGRIAREVHDEIGQSLTALAMDVAWLRGRLARRKGTAELGAKLDAMEALVRDTIESVQRIASDLRPRILDDLGLHAAAEWAVRAFEERTGIACRFQSDARAIEETRARAVFRILQESLTNVGRHARAKRVDVRVVVGPREIRLIVRDDGIGIDPERLTDARSLGLIGMRERVLSLGGVLQVERPLMGGTMVCARIPLPASVEFAEP